MIRVIRNMEKSFYQSKACLILEIDKAINNITIELKNSIEVPVNR